ncbi:MAG: hypothetical protein ABH986_06130 [archaeon]
MPEKHKKNIVQQRAETLMNSITGNLTAMQGEMHFSSTSVASHSNPHLKQAFMESASANLSAAVNHAKQLKRLIDLRVLNRHLQRRAKDTYKRVMQAERKMHSAGHHKIKPKLRRIPGMHEKAARRIRIKVKSTGRKISRIFR